jgi:uncharacterized protein (TIGR02118 family)
MMIHMHSFVTRKPGMSDAEFRRYWRETHAPTVRNLKQIRGYVQTHRIPFAQTNSPYDGEAEIWLDSLEALPELVRSREFIEGPWTDSPNFMDVTRLEWMATRDHVIVDGTFVDKLVKLVWQLKRKEGTVLRDFRKYWLDVHGKICAALPGVRRYVQSHLVDDAYLYAEPRHDGVAQFWFDNLDSMRAVLESPAGTRMINDLPNFIDTSTIRNYVAEEHVIVPPPR